MVFGGSLQYKSIGYMALDAFVAVRKVKMSFKVVWHMV